MYRDLTSQTGLAGQMLERNLFKDPSMSRSHRQLVTSTQLLAKDIVGMPLVRSPHVKSITQCIAMYLVKLAIYLVKQVISEAQVTKLHHYWYIIKGTEDC